MVLAATPDRSASAPIRIPTHRIGLTFQSAGRCRKESVRRLPVNAGPSGSGRIRYGLLAVAIGLAGLAGYVGDVVYPRFDLPSVTGAGLLLLAGRGGGGA